MSDLISRQAAKNKKVYSEERHEYVIPVAEIDWLPSAQAEPKWIPCSERLPDSRRSVLITVSNGKDYETSEAYYHELRKDWFEVNGDRVCEMSPSWKTIAWCELPEPWKGEE